MRNSGASVCLLVYLYTAQIYDRKDNESMRTVRGDKKRGVTEGGGG